MTVVCRIEQLLLSNVLPANNLIDGLMNSARNYALHKYYLLEIETQTKLNRSIVVSKQLYITLLFLIKQVYLE